jgi:hypothetical protein
MVVPTEIDRMPRAIAVARGDVWSHRRWASTSRVGGRKRAFVAVGVPMAGHRLRPSPAGRSLITARSRVTDRLRREGSCEDLHAEADWRRPVANPDDKGHRAGYRIGPILA